MNLGHQKFINWEIGFISSAIALWFSPINIFVILMLSVLKSYLTKRVPENIQIVPDIQLLLVN